MSVKNILKDLQKLSKIAIIIVFLALIRCISEPFRLQHYAVYTLNFEEVKPFLLGALVTAIALLIMTILFYYGKNKLIIAISILTIVLLLIIKQLYLEF